MAETSKRITVLIVDDHAVVREGLRTFLELQDDLQVIGEARSGAEAVEQARRLSPDVVLMDLVMPGMDGIAATREIRALNPETQVIALTSFSEDDRVFAAVKAGASGYLLKDVSPADLARAIRGVNQGEAHLQGEVAKKLLDEIVDKTKEPAADELTAREREVLGLIGQGLSNRQIAAELVISEKTVKGYVSNILSKLHLADRTQAAIYAIRKGLAPSR